MLIGLLGGGFAGCELHLHTLSLLARDRPDLEVVCAESNQAQWACLQRYPFVRCIHPTMEALIAREVVDGFIVALPTELHYEAAMQIALHAPPGLPVLMEKPLASTFAEAQAISVLLERQRVLMGLTGRYHPEFVAAKEALPRIGRVTEFRETIELRFEGDGACEKLAQNQGVVRTLGVHTLDRLRYFFVDEPKLCCAYTGNFTWGQIGEDCASVRAHVGGAEAELEWRWPREECFEYRTVVTGERGQLLVQGFTSARLYLDEREGFEVLFQHKPAATVVERHYPGFQAEMSEFLSLIDNIGQQPSVTLGEGAAAQRLVEEIYSIAAQC